MGIGAGLYMYDVFVKTFTFAVSSPGEFLFFLNNPRHFKPILSHYEFVHHKL